MAKPNTNTPQYWNRVWKLTGEYRGTAGIYELAASLIPSNSAILDLGCGTGWGLRFLKGAGHRVLGVDYAEECARFFDNGEFVLGDIQKFVPKERYDLVLCVMALYCLDHPERIIKTAHDALAPDGKFLVANPGKHRWKEEFHYIPTSEELYSLVSNTFTDYCLSFNHDVWKVILATK